MFASQSVQAATLTVSTTADAGAGSLRQAIIDANSNAAANIVIFNIPLSDPGYSILTDRFTINLVNQLPNLPLAPLTIDNAAGRSVTVKGNSSFRIFTLVDSAVVNISNLVIRDGSSGGGLGGGIYMGNSAVLFLNSCTVSNNSATRGGGGIWVNDSGTLHVINSTISDNTATNGDGGGGIFISVSGTLNITGSTVSGNTATNGGGGGIYNGVSGTLNATNITVSGNTASDLGGGILNNATATINSSTISGNTSTNGGGGIYNNFTATLNNSLIALNTGADGPDLLGRGSRGKPFSGNSNLIGNADGSEAFGPTTNQLGSTGSPIDPRLGPLQDNGGRTFTQALLAGSPAIDAGTTALATDQRGVTRPQDGDGVGGAQSDIGAFELPVVLATDADAYVKGASPDANFGRLNELQIKRTLNPGSGKGRQAYMRFDTASVSGTITKATLRLYGRLNSVTVSNANIPCAVFPVSQVWQELTLTWNNKPAPNVPTELSRVTVIGDTARWYEFDITTFVNQERAAGRMTAGLLLRNMQRGETGDFYTIFNSKEATANRPQLVIEQ